MWQGFPCASRNKPLANNLQTPRAQSPLAARWAGDADEAVWDCPRTLLEDP
jgi:hypothetical protein